MAHRHHGHDQRQPHGSERQHQRFSWQTPPATPPEADVQSHQQPQQQPQQEQPQARNNPNPQHNRVFSYAQTPIEHRAPFYESSPDDPPMPLPQSPATPIDPRPQSVYNPVNLASTTTPQPQTTYLTSTYPQDEKPPLSPVSPQEGTLPPRLSPVSPLTEPLHVHAPQQYVPPSHHRQRSNLSPINTNVNHYVLPTIPATPQSQASPLPQKKPMTPISSEAKHPPEFPEVPKYNRQSYANNGPYSPHGFDSSTTTQTPHAIFSPDSFHGPNGLDFSRHQPGQITHPNMDLTPKGTAHEWKHSLCECSGDVSTCLTGLFCPCVLYGRTAHRLSQKSDKKDPTDMLAYKATNGHCMLMGASCGLWCLFPLVQRTRLRHLYKLTGSLGSDVLKACCCCCCVAIQNEREVKSREESSRRWAGPASTDVYSSPPQMTYAPQR
ncbi:PLAC8-domain-containing protein [Corynespora cassiicola Philippines]|uniref:PLAC8-domain-containing protein n=1 Tax=Corynespora cassiicola Philippines TaxID=1448308 RepID=A0A2T2NKZ8_CORCC|nr:PLAC8-domain-containing protein [Corynespora cassiicola Philippines]